MRVSAIVALSFASTFTTVAAHAAMLTETACTAVASQASVDDVTYRPGVDVRGNRVRQADLQPRPDITPNPIAVDISVQLPNRHGVSPRTGRLKAEVPVARFIVTQDGVTTADGQPLDPTQPLTPSAACRRLGGG